MQIVLLQLFICQTNLTKYRLKVSNGQLEQLSSYHSPDTENGERRWELVENYQQNFEDSSDVRYHVKKVVRGPIYVINIHI